MDASLQTVEGFRAKEASVIFLVTLIAILGADYFLVALLKLLQTRDLLPIWPATAIEVVAATRSIALGFLNPAVMMVVTLLLMKSYLPSESISSLCNRIGLHGKPSSLLFGLSFGMGAMYVFAFMALEYVFPRNEFAAPHPENVINVAPVGGKVLFAFAACTLVPFAEEVLFRGILYQGFANSWGKVVSTVCVSSMFIAVHPGTLESGYWLTHTALYMAPIFLTILRELGGSLYAPIAGHAGINFAEIFF
ncbi:MAG TPA: type II CAAX endopeptidase family protein [Pseudomonadales bacterium]